MSRTSGTGCKAGSIALTKAQEAVLPLALSTAPSDRKQAEKGIRAFYDAHNWKYPKFIWIDSPGELEKLHHVKKAVNLPWQEPELGGFVPILA